MARLPAALAAPLGAGELVDGVEDPGAATFVLGLEPGTKITYAWSTSIVTSHAGFEQRESPFGQPRRRVDGVAFLLDGGDRAVKGAMMRAAARGVAFSVALPFEELVITADSTGTTIAVGSTALCDWALVGQRVAIVGGDGTVVLAVVQSTTSTTIEVAPVDDTGVPTSGSVGVAGRAGGRIMPVIPMLLDPQQGFSRYPVTADLWSLRALAASFGFAGADRMGVGAELLTINDGDFVPAADLADDDLVIWDRPNLSAGASNEAMASRASVVDLGALAFGIGAADAPDWGRSILYRSSSLAEFAWLKAFLRRARGRQGAFLLSTNRPDFVFVATTTGGFKITTEGDYASWFVSVAHRRLALTTSAGTVYATITDVTDNEDGTLTLASTATIAGTVTKVSLLEQLRFASDELAVTWDSGVFTFEEAVVTVQDTIIAPTRFFFDTVVETAVFTLPVEDKVISARLGTTTLINYRSDRSLSVAGVIALDGAGSPTTPADNAVICVCNTNSNTNGMTLLHESSSASAIYRFRNAGAAGLGGTRNAIWYRYRAASQRWHEFFATRGI